MLQLYTSLDPDQKIACHLQVEMQLHNKWVGVEKVIMANEKEAL